MHKRPKSREETPKEGSGNASRYRTATICGRAAQSARAFGLTFHVKFAGLAKRQHKDLYFNFKKLHWIPFWNRSDRAPMGRALDVVILPLDGRLIPVPARFGIQNAAENYQVRSREVTD